MYENTIIHRDSIHQMLVREVDLFVKLHPTSVQLGTQTHQHFLFGVPLHWMADWHTPMPVFVNQAQGAEFTCVDGHTYFDFCLGDTGAMFGHSPKAIAQTLAQQATQGFTTMLPSSDAIRAGAALYERFQLPFWQMAITATDANRFVVRWARAITQRKKILVFNGCYHGTIDDVFVDLNPNDPNLSPITRPSLLGQVYNLSEYTDVVEFNDIEAVRAKLISREFACVLTEPALTNCGMVLPEPHFLQQLRQICTETNTLLIFDETHTLSAGYSGVTGTCHEQFNFLPDFIVLGKAIAGGFPCAVYGMTEAMARKAQLAKKSAPEGHSGIGTTLAGNRLSMALLACNLTQVATQEAFERMLTRQTELTSGLVQLLSNYHLPWSVTQLGARSEFQFCTTAPQNATEAKQAMDHELERVIHLYLINRGIMITPFHNMTLVCPETNTSHVQKFLAIFQQCLTELTTP